MQLYQVEEFGDLQTPDLVTCDSVDKAWSSNPRSS